MTVHKVYQEEYPMSQMNHYGSYPRSDAPLADKPHELGSDDTGRGSVEGGDGKTMSDPEEVTACNASGDE